MSASSATKSSSEAENDVAEVKKALAMGKSDEGVASSGVFKSCCIISQLLLNILVHFYVQYSATNSLLLYSLDTDDCCQQSEE